MSAGVASREPAVGVPPPPDSAAAKLEAETSAIEAESTPLARHSTRAVSSAGRLTRVLESASPCVPAAT